MDTNFTLPDSENGNGRKPSVFAASFLFLLAGMGKLVGEYVAWPFVFLAGRLFGGVDAGAQSQLTQFLYYILFVALPVMLYARRDPKIVSHLRIEPLKGRVAALSVLTAAVAVLFINCVSQLWFILVQCMGGTIPASGVAVPTTVRGLASAVILSAVLPGICEELLFRGLMLSAWEERGSLRAVTTVSLLFTLLHGNLLGIPSEFICGVLLACIVISSGSLFAGMVFHTVFNSTLLIASYWARTVETDAEAAYTGALSLLPFLLGALLFGSILMFLMRRFRALRLRDGRKTFGVPPCPERPVRMSELIVQISGVIVASVWYVIDLFRISGFLQ